MSNYSSILSSWKLFCKHFKLALVLWSDLLGLIINWYFGDSNGSCKPAGSKVVEMKAKYFWSHSDRRNIFKLSTLSSMLLWAKQNSKWQNTGWEKGLIFIYCSRIEWHSHWSWNILLWCVASLFCDYKMIHNWPRIFQQICGRQFCVEHRLCHVPIFLILFVFCYCHPNTFFSQHGLHFENRHPNSKQWKSAEKKGTAGFFI